MPLARHSCRVDALIWRIAAHSPSRNLLGFCSMAARQTDRYGIMPTAEAQRWRARSPVKVAAIDRGLIRGLAVTKNRFCL
jgi:hypothetical protein